MLVARRHLEDDELAWRKFFLLDCVGVASAVLLPALDARQNLFRIFSGFFNDDDLFKNHCR